MSTEPGVGGGGVGPAAETQGPFVRGLAASSLPVPRRLVGDMRGLLLPTLLGAALAQVSPSPPASPRLVFLQVGNEKGGRRWAKRGHKFLVARLPAKRGAILLSKQSWVLGY